MDSPESSMSNRWSSSPRPAERQTQRACNVSKAKKRAEEGELALFSGEEALTEVAKSDGVWNWALVGPDPDRLPLSGGSKSIEEMRSAFGKHAHCFGLLRMTFGVGADAATRFLFIHASDEVGSGNFSNVERGQASGMEPRMEEAIRKFTAFSGKIRLHSKEECTVETLVDKLRSEVRGVDVERLTVANLYAAVEHHKQQHPEELQKERLEQKKQEHLEKVEAPRAEAAEPEREVIFSEMQTESMRQRKRVKLWSKGDVVEIFSLKHQRWFLDAEIAEVIKESCTHNNFKVVAGSMKVVYDNGKHFKWVAPQEMDEFIRPSPRPRPADAIVGELLKETHFLFFTQWTKHYFELSKGFLQWWHRREDAMSKKMPVGCVYLLGLQLQESGATFKIRTDGAKGTVYAFQAGSIEMAASWVEALWAHSAYCDEDREFSETKMAGLDVRKELLSTITRKEPLSAAGSKTAASKLDLAAADDPAGIAFVRQGAFVMGGA